MLALLLACASPAPAPGSVLLEGAPHVVQRPDFCGEACVEMALARLGYTVDQDAVFDAAGVDPALGRGLVARELYATLLAFGFAVGDTWYPLPVAPQWDALLADLHAGVPSIVCLTTEGGGEHFVLVLGYDAGTDELVVHDPGDVDGAHARLPRSRFLARWPLGGHTLVRLRLEPMAPLTLPTPADGVTPADLAQAVRR
ncbi:MAG: C39 family peptidase, partial [Myxococcota bacterium]